MKNENKKRACEYLGGNLNEHKLHCVRSVSPNKDMFCLSFTLPQDIAFDQTNGYSKRQKVDTQQ